MRSPRPFSARPCRFCGQALSALERVQGDTCRRLDCRRRATNEQRAAERAADLAQRQRRHARMLDAPALLEAPVLWLLPYTARVVPLANTTRREHVAWLDALVALPPPEGAPPAAADPSPGPALGGRVCGFCSGRCCSLGAQRHAFIDRTLLQRHAEQATAGDVAAAAHDYAQRIPAEHAHGGCVYQGRTGCVLPREMRADICNVYRCDPLVQASRQAGSASGVVLAMATADGTQRAAWAHDTGLLPLPKRPRRPALKAPKGAPATPR